MKKKIVIYLFSVIGILIIVLIIFLVPLVVTLSLPSKEKVIREFYNNEANLHELMQLLESCDYENLQFRYRNRKLEAFSTDKRNDGISYMSDVILDEIIIKKVSNLMRNNRFLIIEKRRNYVLFQRGGNFRYGVGVLYLLEGDEPQNNRFVELEKLPLDNWYYYVE
ncbi:MAG: hypothetical protein FWE91_11270 [Defluviitaleaceae bacterium]|nr:hypothetical protein [Defluviitaleaceae bacterium]MCL2837134.1 hypothetical protein [Defluviitaleaceae bacterium]